VAAEKEEEEVVVEATFRRTSCRSSLISCERKDRNQ